MKASLLTVGVYSSSCMRKSARGVVETAGFTSPLVMPPGTYTPLATDVSADGVTMAAEAEAVIQVIGISLHQIK